VCTIGKFENTRRNVIITRGVEVYCVFEEFDVLFPLQKEANWQIISQNCYAFADGKRGRHIIFNTKFLHNVFID